MTCQCNENLVEPNDACPQCGQRHVDRLVWIDDGEQVRCAVCSTIYTPPALRKEGGADHAAPTR